MFLIKLNEHVQDGIAQLLYLLFLARALVGLLHFALATAQVHEAHLQKEVFAVAELLQVVERVHDAQVSDHFGQVLRAVCAALYHAEVGRVAEAWEVVDVARLLLVLLLDVQHRVLLVQVLQQLRRLCRVEALMVLQVLLHEATLHATEAVLALREVLGRYHRMLVLRILRRRRAQNQPVQRPRIRHIITLERVQLLATV